MKLLFTGLLLISSVLSYSQNNNWVFSGKLDWSNHQDQISKTEKKHIVDSIFSVSPFKKFERDFINDSLFHFIDLNNDGKIDLIYNGFAGNESDRILIYIKKNQKYTLVTDYFGELIDLVFENKALKKILIDDYPCCAGVINQYETYEFNASSNEFTIIEKVACYFRTKLPQQRTIGFQFTTVNDNYRMRFEPKINNKNDTELKRFEAIGNIIAEFPKGSTGLAVAEQTDKTGRIWWFVIMDAVNKPSSSIFYGGNNNELPFKTSGWMSSRYLKKQ